MKISEGDTLRGEVVDQAVFRGTVKEVLLGSRLEDIIASLKFFSQCLEIVIVMYRVLSTSCCLEKLIG